MYVTIDSLEIKVLTLFSTTAFTRIQAMAGPNTVTSIKYPEDMEERKNKTANPVVRHTEINESFSLDTFIINKKNTRVMSNFMLYGAELTQIIEK